MESSDDLTRKVTIVKSSSDSMEKHSVKVLLKEIDKMDKEIRSLEFLQLSKSEATTRMNKTKVPELKWT
jgi:hypothetical protein